VEEKSRAALESIGTKARVDSGSKEVANSHLSTPLFSQLKSLLPNSSDVVVHGSNVRIKQRLLCHEYQSKAVRLQGWILMFCCLTPDIRRILEVRLMQVQLESPSTPRSKHLLYTMPGVHHDG
jgi:hypothetical protein